MPRESRTRNSSRSNSMVQYSPSRRKTPDSVSERFGRGVWRCLRCSDLVGEGHTQRRCGLEGLTVERVRRGGIPGSSAPAEDPGEIVLTVSDPRSGSHLLVEGDGRPQMAFGLVQAIDGAREQPEVAVDRAHAALGVGDGVTTGEWRQLLKEDLRGRRASPSRAQASAARLIPKSHELSRYSAANSPAASSLELGARLGDLAEVEQETDQHRPEHADTRESRRWPGGQPSPPRPLGLARVAGGSRASGRRTARRARA